jgi:hypothetical protein
MIEAELDYEVMPDWPALSWLAVCEPGAKTVAVFHGTKVETRPGWFCEAVWDGDFSDGGFDRTDFVFGSGARCRKGAICFVTSGASLDRLNYVEHGRSLLISNSLACLLAVTGRDPDPYHRGYVELFASIQHGLMGYDRRVPLVDGSAQLVYFHNLVWDGHRLREVPKVLPKHDLSGYEAYIGVLGQGLGSIAANMSSPQRAFSYEWQGTLSRGYDSPAAAALAKDAGLTSVLSFNESRPGIPDDGRLIAQSLGLEINVVDRLRWQEDELCEPPFLSADGQGKEVFIAAAQDQLRGRVLVTGFGGDYVWARDPKPLNGNLVRGGHSGLSLAEFRLHVGFINLAVPFMCMKRVVDICRISQSPEMSAWDIGGAYTRPIPRRLLEERGVARELFGMDKTGASMRYVIGQDAWSANGHKEYLSWLLATPSLPANRWSRRSLMLFTNLQRWLLLICDVTPPGAAHRLRKALHLLARGLRRFGVHDFPFLWGIDLTRQSYPFRSHEFSASRKRRGV